MITKDILEKIRELEKQGKVIPATFDAVFKGLFQDPSMKNILAYIIHKVTMLKEDYLLEHMTFSNSELAKSKVALKSNTTDLFVDVLDKCILLEMNQFNNKENEFRNNAHYYGAIVNNLRVNDNHKNIKRIYQINFDNEKPISDNLLAEIVSIDKYTGIVDNDFYKKYRINLVKVREKDYTNFSELTRFERILLIMQLEDKNKLREVAKGDEELMAMVDKIEDMSKDPEYVSIYDEDKLNRLAKSYGDYMDRKEAREQGHAEGLAEGKAEGLAEGKAEGLAEGKAEGKLEGKLEANLETARKMLHKKMNIKDISEVTGLSEADINELLKENS